MRRSRSSLVRLIPIVLACAPFALFACGADTPTPVTPTTATSSSDSASTMASAPMPSASDSSTSVAAVAPPLPAITVEDVTPSEDPKPTPTVKILAPTEGASIDPKKALDYEVSLDIKDWTVGVGSTHVHLILDNNAYKPIYTTKAKVKLSELLPKDGTLAEGQHVLHAFPSRMTHESVKAKGALTSVTFWVGKKGTPTIDLKKPLVIYSRPKGDYSGPKATGSVLFDFYLRNTDLTDGRKVRWTLTGPGIDSLMSGTFDKWAPHALKNLRKGEYFLKLELLEKDGSLNADPLNTILRKFTVDPDAADPAPMAMPAPSASASSSAKSK